MHRRRKWRVITVFDGIGLSPTPPLPKSKGFGEGERTARYNIEIVKSFISWEAG
jgi:hypothetical protein